MQSWMKIIGVFTFGGLLLIFMTYKPTPEAYIIISSPLTSTPYPDLNVSRHYTSLIVANDTEAQGATHSPVSQANVTESSLHYDIRNIISGAAKTPIRGEENIFFIESSCAVGGSKTALFMNARQGCAVESTALANPNATVYYIYTCLDVQEFKASHPTAEEVIHEVFSYPNVKSYHLELAKYLNNTPFSENFSIDKLKGSTYPVEHSSDTLRIVTLWKFGGIYLDLDFIITRPFTDLKYDFLVAETDEVIANCVLSFCADGVGHEVAADCLEELFVHFDGRQWGYNGPNLITRVMSRRCDGVEVRNMTPEKCKGITVHQKSLFLPFYYVSWKLLFDEESSNSTMALILKNTTYGVHAWNKMSHGEPVKVGSKQPYSLLASRFCPKVYSVLGETF